MKRALRLKQILLIIYSTNKTRTEIAFLSHVQLCLRCVDVFTGYLLLADASEAASAPPSPPLPPPQLSKPLHPSRHFQPSQHRNHPLTSTGPSTPPLFPLQLSPSPVFTTTNTTVNLLLLLLLLLLPFLLLILLHQHPFPKWKTPRRTNIMIIQDEKKMMRTMAGHR